MTPRDELQHALNKLAEADRRVVQAIASDLSTDDSGLPSDMYSVVGELSDEQVRQLLGIARAMALPVSEELLTGSTVTTPEYPGHAFRTDASREDDAVP